MSSDIDRLIAAIDATELVEGPIGRQRIALYAGASGDYNGIHVDLDFARAAGLPDVIVHGMYSMGLLSRLITRLAPRVRVLEIASRFQAMVEVGATLRCTARVSGRTETQDGTVLELQLAARRVADGSDATIGTARVLVPSVADAGSHGGAEA